MSHQNPAVIIGRKRDGKILSKDEIRFFIEQFTAGKISEGQMGSWLMAVFLKGMNKSETAALTEVMLNSGKVFNFNLPEIIDKHSTGGVGDKTSLIIAPIAAVCGVKVPMISGRGLGHTGGTVDKMESIPGFRTQITLAEFEKLLFQQQLVMTGQTAEIAPADKLIYALRDVTGTVESIPLITASIMSKKLAEGCSGFVFDVKFGSGAFMADKKRARALAKSLSETASAFHKKSITFLTNMNQPLGKMIGHSLEVIECIETLKGQGPKDLTDLSLQLAGAMIYLAGKAKTIAAGIKMAQQTITDGSALKKFTEMVKVQGGQAAIVQNYDLLPVANSKTTIPFMTAGFLAEIDTKEVGLLMSILGGARTIPNQKIDLSVGMEFHGELGKKYKKGDALVTLYHHAKQTAEVAMITERMNNLIKMSRLKPAKLDPLILEILP